MLQKFRGSERSRLDSRGDGSAGSPIAQWYTSPYRRSNPPGHDVGEPFQLLPSCCRYRTAQDPQRISREDGTGASNPTEDVLPDGMPAALMVPAALPSTSDLCRNHQGPIDVAPPFRQLPKGRVCSTASFLRLTL